MNKKTDSEAERERIQQQLKSIHQLATRLPWIVLGISLLAFAIIFLQIYLTKS